MDAAREAIMDLISVSWTGTELCRVPWGQIVGVLGENGLFPLSTFGDSYAEPPHVRTVILKPGITPQSFSHRNKWERGRDEFFQYTNLLPLLPHFILTSALQFSQDYFLFPSMLSPEGLAQCEGIQPYFSMSNCYSKHTEFRPILLALSFGPPSSESSNRMTIGC